MSQIHQSERAIMDIIRTIDGLPTRIQRTLEQGGYNPGVFRAALQTALKPNATIPILWLVLVKSALLLCSTHRTRGVYYVFGPGDINEVRVLKGKMRSFSIEVIHPTVGEPSIIIPMPEGVASTVLREFVRLVNETLGLS